jgi:hypothetical protein
MSDYQDGQRLLHYFLADCRKAQTADTDSALWSARLDALLALRHADACAEATGEDRSVFLAAWMEQAVRGYNNVLMAREG